VSGLDTDPVSSPDTYRESCEPGAEVELAELRSTPRTGASGATWVSSGTWVSPEIDCGTPVTASADEVIQRCNAVSASWRWVGSSITT